MFKKLLSIALVYLMTIPVNYLPYISAGILQARKYRVTVIDIYTGDSAFSKRMSQFIKDELETKNRIEYFAHNIELKIQPKPEKKDVNTAKRVFDETKFEEIKDILKDIEQQKKDQEYSMLVESYQQIIDIYEENFENLKTMQPLFEAYLYKSYYEGLDEMDDEAKEDMKTAVSIGRNLVFNPKNFAPRFLVKYKRTRKRSKKYAKGTFVLDAPSSYELIIDGISLGNAPVKVTKLSYGKHYVVVLDENKKVAKKSIIELSKRKKQEKIKIVSKDKPKKEEVKQDEEQDKDILAIIYKNLEKDDFNVELQKSLSEFAKKVNADFIVFGNAKKKHDMYNAKFYLFNAETKTIAFLTKGEFDTDLLTGDVEGLRVGNEIVKGIDNFSSLKAVELKKKEKKKTQAPKKAALRIVPFPDYKELKFDEIKEDTKTVAAVVVKKEDKKDDINLDEVDTVKEDEGNVDIADADYNELNNSELNTFYDDKKDKEESVWYKKWWVWGIAGVIVVGAAAGTVYYMNSNNDSGSSVATGTW